MRSAWFVFGSPAVVLLENILYYIIIADTASKWSLEGDECTDSNSSLTAQLLFLRREY
jgi:hypothetical protein